MTEFTKLKIMFSLALLAALFALNPLLKVVGAAGYDFLGIRLQVKLAYYVLAGLLGVTVYLYGIELVTERPILSAKKAANISYGLAILIIPLFVALFLVAQIAQLMEPLIRSAVALTLFLTVIGIVLGALNIWLAWGLSLKLGEKDRKSTVEQLSKEQNVLLSRAAQLFRDGHYDLTIVECFKALELSIRKALVSASIAFRPTVMDILSKAEKHKLIPHRMRGHLQEIRMLRNKAVHAQEPLSKDTAQHVLNLTSQMLSFLEGEEAFATAKKNGIEVATWIGTQEAPVRGWLAPGSNRHYVTLANLNPESLVVSGRATITGDGITYEGGVTSWEIGRIRIPPVYERGGITTLSRQLIVRTRRDTGVTVFKLSLSIGEGREPKTIVLTFAI